VSSVTSFDANHVLGRRKISQKTCHERDARRAGNFTRRGFCIGDAMDIGVFIPIDGNGWLVSTTWR